MTRRRRRHHQRGHIGRNPMKSGLQICYRVQAPDGTWRQHWETLPGVWSRKEARKVLDTRLAVVNNPGYREPARLTLKEFVATVWEEHLASIKKSTAASYRSAARRVLLVLGALPLAEITTTQADELLAAERKRGASAKSRLNFYLLLGAMFNLAKRKKLIAASPLDEEVGTGLRREVKNKRKPKPTLTPEQVRAALAALPAASRPLVALLATTGLRISEALGLQWADLDFTRNTFRVERAVVRGRAEPTPKTAATEGTRPLGPVLRATLLQHRACSFYTGAGDWVFCAGNGSPLDADDWRKRIWYPALKRAGIERTEPRAFGFHLLRHTAATLFLQSTRDLKATQTFLGHANVNTTAAVYAKYLAETERTDAARLEETLFAAAPSEAADNSLVIVSEEEGKVN